MGKSKIVVIEELGDCVSDVCRISNVMVVLDPDSLDTNRAKWSKDFGYSGAFSSWLYKNGLATYLDVEYYDV